VGFVKDDNAVLGQIFGNPFGDLGVQEVVVGVDNDVAELHLNMNVSKTRLEKQRRGLVPSAGQ
jgi:hypothetical protein